MEDGTGNTERGPSAQVPGFLFPVPGSPLRGFHPRSLPLVPLALALVALALACGSGDEDPNAIRVTGTGNGASLAFMAAGPFDVRVTGADVTADNSRLFVFQIHDGGRRIEMVASNGPKVEGVSQRPGSVLDVTFDIAPGEYYVLLKTEGLSEWTMTIASESFPQALTQ